MGSPDNEEGRFSDEGPVHKVCVDGFWMGKYEVTNAQYRKFKPKHDSSDFNGKSLNGDTQPVVNISWKDASAFANWLLEQNSGKGIIRMPTEAEWEYAARAGMQTAYSFGNNVSQLGQYAWYRDNSSSQTHPVGEKKPNMFGLYDIHGNVWEWCEDAYHDNYTDAPDDGSAWGVVGDRKANVVRGGPWYDKPSFLRSAVRYRTNKPEYNYKPDSRLNIIGTRLVRTE